MAGLANSAITPRTKRQEQTEISSEVGLAQLIEDIELLEDDKGLIVEKLSDLDTQIEGLIKKRAERADYYYQLALDGLEKHLEGLGWSDLRERAESSASTTDDNLVRQIDDANRQLEELKELRKEETQAIGRKKSSLDNLNLLLTRFIQAGFDSEHSIFSSKLDFNRMMRELSEGSTDCDSALFQAPQSTLRT